MRTRHGRRDHARCRGIACDPGRTPANDRRAPSGHRAALPQCPPLNRQRPAARRSHAPPEQPPRRPEPRQLGVQLPDPVEDVVGDLLLLFARRTREPPRTGTARRTARSPSGTAAASSCAPGRSRGSPPARPARPDSSAIRPIPGRASSAILPAPRAAALAVHDRPRHRARGSRSAVMNASSSWYAAPDREHAAVAEHPPGDALEQLRLAHELDPPADERAGEEVVHERGVVRREDHRPVRDVLAPDTRAPGTTISAFSSVNTRTVSYTFDSGGRDAHHARGSGRSTPWAAGPCRPAA